MSNLNKPLIIIAAWIAIPFGLCLFVALPLVLSVMDAGVKIGQQASMIDDYNVRILKAREFASFFKQQADNFRGLENILVDRQMPLDFISSLEAAARETGVRIGFAPSMAQQNAKGDLPSLTVEADVSGSVSDILRFLEKIENTYYLVSVQSVDLQAAVGAPTPPEQSGMAAPGTAGRAQIMLKAYAKP